MKAKVPNETHSSFADGELNCFSLGIVFYWFIGLINLKYFYVFLLPMEINGNTTSKLEISNLWN